MNVRLFKIICLLVASLVINASAKLPFYLQEFIKETTHERHVKTVQPIEHNSGVINKQKSAKTTHALVTSHEQNDRDEEDNGDRDETESTNTNGHDKDDEDNDEDNNDAGQEEEQKEDTEERLKAKLEEARLRAHLKLLRSAYKDEEAKEKTTTAADFMKSMAKETGNNVMSFAKVAATQYVAFCLNIYLANLVIPGKPLGDISFRDILMLRFLDKPLMSPAIPSVNQSNQNNPVGNPGPDMPNIDRPFVYRILRGFWGTILGS